MYYFLHTIFLPFCVASLLLGCSDKDPLIDVEERTSQEEIQDEKSGRSQRGRRKEHIEKKLKVGIECQLEKDTVETEEEVQLNIHITTESSSRSNPSRKFHFTYQMRGERGDLIKEEKKDITPDMATYDTSIKLSFPTAGKNTLHFTLEVPPSFVIDQQPHTMAIEVIDPNVRIREEFEQRINQAIQANNPSLFAAITEDTEKSPLPEEDKTSLLEKLHQSILSPLISQVPEEFQTAVKAVVCKKEFFDSLIGLNGEEILEKFEEGIMKGVVNAKFTKSNERAKEREENKSDFVVYAIDKHLEAEIKNEELYTLFKEIINLPDNTPEQERKKKVELLNQTRTQGLFKVASSDELLDKQFESASVPFRIFILVSDKYTAQKRDEYRSKVDQIVWKEVLTARIFADDSKIYAVIEDLSKRPNLHKAGRELLTQTGLTKDEYKSMMRAYYQVAATEECEQKVYTMEQSFAP